LISTLCKEIDNNQDGFISLIAFLSINLKHKSTKLALKEISRKIEFDESLSTEDYFSRKKLQTKQEMNLVSFTKFFL
jgi:hypothetical protein